MKHAHAITYRLLPNRERSVIVTTGKEFKNQEQFEKFARSTKKKGTYNYLCAHGGFFQAVVK